MPISTEALPGDITSSQSRAIAVVVLTNSGPETRVVPLQIEDVFTQTAIRLSCSI